MKAKTTAALTGRQLNLDILRIALTILVVFGHADYYTVHTAFGGIDYASLMLAGG